MADGRHQTKTEPVPLDAGDTISLKEAAYHAGVSDDTVRRWSNRYGIGRQLSPGTPWRVSLPALQMLLACDEPALEAFRAGDRSGALVRPYITRQQPGDAGGAA
jgi:hypothetical protein